MVTKKKLSMERDIEEELSQSWMGTNGLPAYNFIMLAFELHIMQVTEQPSAAESGNYCQIVSSLKSHLSSSGAQRS